MYGPINHVQTEQQGFHRVLLLYELSGLASVPGSNTENNPQRKIVVNPQSASLAIIQIFNEIYL